MIAVDTNLLVYAFDTAYPEKKRVCQKIIADIFEGNQQGAVTNQILAEFALIVTTKIKNPLSKETARSIVISFLASGNWKILNYDCTTVFSALERTMDFWDALIACTLEHGGVRELLTENVKDFTDTTLRVVNPLAAGD